MRKERPSMLEPSGTPARRTRGKAASLDQRLAAARARSAVQAVDPLGEDKDLIIANIRALQRHFHEALGLELERFEERIKQAGRRLRRRLQSRFAGEEDLILLDVDKAVAKVRNETNANLITPLADKLREGGIGIHENQVRTIVAGLLEMTLNLNVRGENGIRSGVVLGPMQSGKTGIALGFGTFIAPILYLVTGVRFYPLFLTTNQHSHREQTKGEYQSVLDLYGDIEIYVGERSTSLNGYFTAPDFMAAAFGAAGFARDDRPSERFVSYPTPNNYHAVVLGDAEREMGVTYDVKDLIQPRVRGRAVTRLQQRMNQAAEMGFSLLLLLDEPQHGAAGEDPISYVDDRGRLQTRGCVIKQILQNIEEDVLGASGKHAAVAFSATPFEMTFDEFFLVRSYLAPSYVGFNMWDGEPIDPTVDTKMPAIYRFSSPELTAVDRAMPDIAKYFATTAASRTWLADKRISVARARAIAGVLFRKMVDHFLADRPDAGVCVRFVANNQATGALIREMGLDRDHEIVRFDGDSHASIRQQIAQARRNSPRRLLIAVTNKARMGDNFPKEIELFIDFTGGPTTLNALLQSMVGTGVRNGKVPLQGGPLRQGGRHSRRLYCHDGQGRHHALARRGAGR